MTQTDNQASPFWRFSLRFYRQPGVADACIALQEQSGVDVNLLLYLLWYARDGRSFTVTEVEAVERRIAPWRESTVVPLRAVRRALKTPPALVEAAAAEAFRTRIKAVELESERLQQEALFALAAGLATEDAATVETAASANVAAYGQVLGRPLKPAAVAALLGALAADPP